MTLRSEKERLRQDHPHLTPEFKGLRGSWECHLLPTTWMFRPYVVKTGHGRTKVEALLDARGGIDADVPAASRRETRAKRLAEEAAAREKSLDDAVFSTIP
jgi:hypothetical protein